MKINKIKETYCHDQKVDMARKCNFTLWNKRQCVHRALLHAVSGCCKCFQVSNNVWYLARIAKAPLSLRANSGKLLLKLVLHRVMNVVMIKMLSFHLNHSLLPVILVTMLIWELFLLMTTVTVRLSAPAAIASVLRMLPSLDSYHGYRRVTGCKLQLLNF